MNEQPKNQETITVFYLSEGRIDEFEVPIKPYNQDNELNSQPNPSLLETLTD